MKKIKSINNPTIKQIATLQTTKGRKKYQQFIAEGLRTCKTLMASPLTLIQLYVTEKMVEEAQNLSQNITLLSEQAMKKIAPTKTPSGMLGVFSIPKQAKPKVINPGLVLAQITDPGNMGTLIRSSIAFDYSQIIIIDGIDPWNPKSVQSSAGTIGFANIIQMSWHELKKHTNRPLLSALVPRKGKEIKIGEKNKLFIIGNEAHGIPEKWLTDCEELLTLSMPGKTESLNAAVAGSLVLYISTIK